MKSHSMLARCLVLLGMATYAHADPTQAPPRADEATRAVSSAYDLKRFEQLSTWMADERDTFTRLLSGAHYDWLVAPVQVQGQGFDRAERSMMTSELSRALADYSVVTPDPYVVARALGEARRTFSLDEVDSLVRLVGATNVVIPFVGHDNASHLLVTVKLYRKKTQFAQLQALEPTCLTWSNLSFSDERPPIDVFEALLPEIAARLGLSPRQSRPASATAGKPFHLPQVPEALVAGDAADDIGNAARFAVLGELAPPGTRAAERLFERTLLTVRHAPADDERAFLEAYSLFRLNLRPAALHVLQGRSSPAIAALTAILNGNLVGTQQLIRATADYRRLILEIQVNDLSRKYRRVNNSRILAPALAAIAGRSDSWNRWLHQRWEYGDPWANESNVALKRLLDQLYPVKGQSLADIVAASESGPGREFMPLSLELTVHDHIGQLLRHEPENWCCLNVFDRSDSWDLLSIIEAWSRMHLAKSVDIALSLRGQPDVAQAMLVVLDRYYAGYPDIEVLHAQHDLALASKSHDFQQKALASSALEHSARAVFAAGGQTDAAIAALTALGPDKTQDLAQAYGNDYPLNPEWINVEFIVDPVERLAAVRRALANTQTDVIYVSYLSQLGGEGATGEAIAALNGRFFGNPRLNSVRDGLGSVPTDPASVLQRARASVSADPDAWGNRITLGRLLVTRGEYAEAQRVLVGYPGFHAKLPENPVELSNYALDAASALYWHGAVKEARVFYSIATRYDTGSEAELSSAMHLRLIAGDYFGALEEARRRAERYPGGVAFDYYLSLLHLLGRSTEAWKTFDLLLDEPMGGSFWDSAIVGHRIAGMTDAALEKWIARPEISRARQSGYPLAAQFLLNWSTNDRVAPQDLVDRVRVLAQEPRGRSNMYGHMAYYPVADGELIQVPPSRFRATVRATTADETAVDSDRLLFARALVALQGRDYQAAVSRFDELAARYLMEAHVSAADHADASYALPDFAYASARCGDPLKLETFLGGLPEASRTFEVFLANSYFETLVHGDNTHALESLHRAFGVMEHYFGRSPSMEYQYAEVNERLYQSSGDVRFRDEALGWSHKVQQLRPWSAWAYLIEAELSSSVAARRKALVKALFLDQLSPRLQSIPAADIQYARAELRKGNPFAREQKAVKPSTCPTKRDLGSGSPEWGYAQ